MGILEELNQIVIQFNSQKAKERKEAFTNFKEYLEKISQNGQLGNVDKKPWGVTIDTVMGAVKTETSAQKKRARSNIKRDIAQPFRESIAALTTHPHVLMPKVQVQRLFEHLKEMMIKDEQYFLMDYSNALSDLISHRSYAIRLNPEIFSGRSIIIILNIVGI
eukprot:gb/GECH01008836.1/.p1 GENE.gb/GECH01008836.1/~~gb/GECH01008836.1/.p1  ORF type:complete len:163 (+),score=39.09 gb/GECH01008836.1/:1-489(+)